MDYYRAGMFYNILLISCYRSKFFFRDVKKHMASPSPRSSTVMSNSYQPTNPDYSRAESESGASTMSETPEVFTRSLK